MHKLLSAAALACLFAGLPGCSSLAGFLQTKMTTVVLVNSSDFDVDVLLYYDDDQNILEALITEIGEELQLRLTAGQRATFSVDCDDLQAIIIDDADLLLVGQLGPEVKTDVLRDGDEFGCGDTITFTFDHSAALFDFSIAVSFE